MKQCPRCDFNKETSSFHTRSDGGLGTYCKTCCVDLQREHYQRHKNDPEFMAKRRARSQKQRQNSKGLRVTSIWHSSIHAAKRRNIPHCFSRDELFEMFCKQEWKCLKTGIPFDLTTGRGKRPFGPAIDRIEPKLNYTLENIQLVCNVYNFAKNEFGESDVVIFAYALLSKLT